MELYSSEKNSFNMYIFSSSKFLYCSFEIIPTILVEFAHCFLNALLKCKDVSTYLADLKLLSNHFSSSILQERRGLLVMRGGVDFAYPYMHINYFHIKNRLVVYGYDRPLVSSFV